MTQKNTQTFTLKDVSKEHVKLFNTLANIEARTRGKSKVEVFTDMLETYFEHRASRDELKYWLDYHRE